MSKVESLLHEINERLKRVEERLERRDSDWCFCGPEGRLVMSALNQPMRCAYCGKRISPTETIKTSEGGTVINDAPKPLAQVFAEEEAKND